MAIVEKYYEENGIKIHYYEEGRESNKLLLIHAQGTNATSFNNVIHTLAKKYHVYAVDCYGHGLSLHHKEKYNIKAIGDDMITFVDKVIGKNVVICGHSSGGLIAAYIAAYSKLCSKLILEDAPLFSCQGERRFKSYNYCDLSTVCNKFINENPAEEKDFPLFYFNNQKAWEFFPESSREKAKKFMCGMAARRRKNKPDKDLKILFWPKYALEGFRGMNDYDPYFGLAFYDDSFHAGIEHEEILKKIRCDTIIMKAKSELSKDGILMGALSDEDVSRAKYLITNSKLIRFDCGHGIHFEKKAEFLECFM